MVGGWSEICFRDYPTPPPLLITHRVNLFRSGVEYLGFICLNIHFSFLLCLEGVQKFLVLVGGGGVESDFSVQLSPKLNNFGCVK